jgi:hypothetical protein
MIRWNKARIAAFEKPTEANLNALAEIEAQMLDARTVLPMNPYRPDYFINEMEKAETMLVLGLQENNIDTTNMTIFEVECAIEKYSKQNAKNNKGEHTDVV